jgi:AcrR family transcriptional regulator
LRERLDAAPTDDPRRALAEAIRSHFETVAPNRKLARLLWREALTHPEIGRRLLGLMDEVRAPVAAYLKRAIRDSRLAPLNTSAVARLPTASLILAFLLDERPDLPRLAEETIDVLLAGAGPRPSA